MFYSDRTKLHYEVNYGRFGTEITVVVNRPYTRRSLSCIPSILVPFLVKSTKRRINQPSLLLVYAHNS